MFYPNTLYSLLPCCPQKKGPGSQPCGAKGGTEERVGSCSERTGGVEEALQVRFCSDFIIAVIHDLLKSLG